jgi:hypothetical protein
MKCAERHRIRGTRGTGFHPGERRRLSMATGATGFPPYGR